MSNLEKFNNTLHTFLSELWDKYHRGCGVCDEYFQNYYRDFLESPETFNTDTSFLLDYLDLVKPQLKLLKNDNITVLKHRVVDHVFFNSEDLELDATEINDIMRYYKVLYVYAYRHTYDGNVNELLRDSMTGKLDMNTLSKDKRDFLSIVKSLQYNKIADINEQLEEQRNKASEEDGGIGGMLGGMLGGLGGNLGGNLGGKMPNNIDMDPESIKKHMNQAFPGAGKLLDNELGQVAMNIMQDMDFSSIDLGDPAKLLKSMMSGNIKEHKGLNNLVGSITSKIESHIESGKINPETLRREAQTLVSEGDEGMNNISSMMEKNEDFMKDMMSKMAGFMGNNIDPDKLQEMMRNVDSPEKLQELAQQMNVDNLSDSEVAEKFTNMIKPNETANTASNDVNTASNDVNTASNDVNTASNDVNTSLSSKKAMLDKLKRLKELKEKQAQLNK